jgi:hypothetical protein
MHQSWFGAVTVENGSEYGVVRRFFCFGFVRPALLSMLPNVLAAGHMTRGCSTSNLAFSFRAPQLGCLFRSAKIAFSTTSEVACEHPCGLRLRSSSPSGPTSL